MPNMLIDRMKNAHLTKQQKIIAEYCIENQDRLANMSSLEVAKEIGVSDASVIRFSRAIGFDGFADFRENMYRQLVDGAYAGGTLTEKPARCRERYQENNTPARYELLMQKNLSGVFKHNSDDDFRRVADLLSEPDRGKYVVGLKECREVACRFGRLLSFMLPGVRTLTDDSHASIRAVRDGQAGDVMILFVFSRCYKADEMYIRMAKERGMTVCVISSEVTDLLQNLADILFLVESDGMSFFNSSVSMTMAGEYILTLVSSRAEFHKCPETGDGNTQEQMLGKMMEEE